MGSFLGSFLSGGHHDGSHTSLGSGSGRTGIGNLIALGGSGKGSGEEQLCILCHHADVCIGSAQSAGAAAHAQHNGDLRHNAGHLCDGGIQLGAGSQHIQALGQLCADGIIERDHRAARLGSQLQDFDVLLYIFDGDSLAVLENSVSLLASRIAAGSAHCAVCKQRGVLPVIEKLGEDFSFGTL